MSSNTSEGTLLSTTRKLLQKSDESYFDIFRETNLHPNWLSLLSVGRIPDPSVNKVQRLYEYLTKKKLVKGE